MSTEDTAASEHGADADTTQVQPPPADAPELAWSIDDDTEDMRPNRHGRLMWAGLSVLVVAVTAALVLLVSTLFVRHSSNTARPQPIQSSPATTTVAAAPAPPPATVTVPPPVTVSAPPPTPGASASAASYLAALQVLGIHWWEGDGGSEKAVATGLQICSDLRAGRSQEAIIHGLVWGDGSIAWKPNEVPIITDDARKIIGAATVHLCPDAP
jgi:Protein of unknown function (DUF732)